jgi:hypothetical protein
MLSTKASVALRAIQAARRNPKAPPPYIQRLAS